MHTPRIILIPLTCLLLAVHAAGYTNSEPYRSVLDAHYIEINGSGDVPVAFRAAKDVFESDNILDLIQAAYDDMLPEGEEPEFVIETVGPNAWQYVNLAGETSRILQLHRTFARNGEGHLVLYSDGDRFFGTYRAVIDITVRDAGESASAYAVTVYAYPENAVSRFFARHFGMAERYFRNKTREITDISVAISRYLLAEDRAPADTIIAGRDELVEGMGVEPTTF